MKLVITTQCKENYSDNPNIPYWKNKGGYVYVVENLSKRSIEKIESFGIPTLTNLIESGNSYAIEYIIDHEIVDDEEVVFESWETQYYLSYQTDKERWVARAIRKLDVSDFDKVIETWVMEPCGERSEWKKEYRARKDGNWYSAEEAVEMLNL